MPYIRWEGRGGESKPGLDILSAEVVTKAKVIPRQGRQGYNVNSGLLARIRIQTQVDLT